MTHSLARVREETDVDLASNDSLTTTSSSNILSKLIHLSKGAKLFNVNGREMDVGVLEFH